MNTEEIIEKHNERHEWLDVVSRRMNELSRELKNNLGVMELIVSNFKKRGHYASEDIGITLNTIHTSKQILEHQSDYPVLEALVKTPFYLKDAVNTALASLASIIQAKKISLNISMLSDCRVQGDESYFSLALSILFCYTIERLEVNGTLEISFNQEKSDFLQIGIHSHDGIQQASGSAFKSQLMDDLNISRAHLIFQQHGGGFVFHDDEKSGVGFVALWPLQG